MIGVTTTDGRGVKFDTKSSEICPVYRIPFLQQSKQFDWLVAVVRHAHRVKGGGRES